MECAERDAAARDLHEGKLFVQMLEARLEKAEQKLELAKEQINVTRKLIVSDISPLVVERLRERSLLHARMLRRNDSETVGTNVGTSLDSDSEDEGSAVSSSSSNANDEYEGINEWPGGDYDPPDNFKL